jgi:hypothetical protein
MVWQPPGHLPGVHAPGTTVPIPYIIEQQARAAQAHVAAALCSGSRTKSRSWPHHANTVSPAS